MTTLEAMPKPAWSSADGRIMLYRGNSLQLLALLPKGSVAVCLTDPPYSSGGAFRGDRVGRSTSEKYQLTGTLRRYAEFAGDNRDQRSYRFWCTMWMGKLLEAIRPGGVCGVFTDWRQLPTTTDALQAGGFVWRGIVPWDKTEGTRPVLGRYRSQCEYVVWGSNGGMPNEGPCLPGLVRCPVVAAEKYHVAGKPEALIDQLAAIAWREDDLLLDPFMGGATSAVVAVRRGLRFIGCEIDDVIFNDAVERVEAEIARTALFNGSD